MGVPGLEKLPGTTLPEGSFTITADDDRLVREAVGEDARDGTGDAHDLWAYVATQRGIGISVADLCALADFNVEDGPMLGSTEMTYAAPLRVGVRYRVTGEVVDIQRKQGRSGTFDIMTYRERLLGDGDDEVASSTSAWILPRREAS